MGTGGVSVIIPGDNRIKQSIEDGGMNNGHHSHPAMNGYINGYTAKDDIDIDIKDELRAANVKLNAKKVIINKIDDERFMSERERISKIDWEIPRKVLHSSIGFLTLGLYHYDPPTLKPLITVLTTSLITVSTVDYFRLRNPSFARRYEAMLGPLMRESEKTMVNGVIWYLIGVIFVLSAYPRDVAVISILTLSWSDTTASTIGRLLGRHSPSLPSHVPLLSFLPFAQRKSLAGFSAATVTGFLIAIGFWWRGSHGQWKVLDEGLKLCGKPLGLWLTASVLGLGGAVVEALDLGFDDNLTLPILTGGVMWAWLAICSHLF